MTIANLPPQAYTQETLKQAYIWLQAQSEEVRTVAPNPDILVSLYLKAKRFGDYNLQTPSAQNFKNELKTLAKEMTQFELPEGLTPLNTKSQTMQNAATSQVAQSTPEANTSSTLDATSLEILNKVKTKLNLSSDAEAIRMLIQLGFDRLKDILPR